MRRFLSRNPYTGKILKEYPFISDAELDQKIQLAGEATKQMRTISQAQKKEQLKCMASTMEKNINKYAEVITAEVGKPFANAKMEVTRAINHCKFYVDHLSEYLQSTQVKTEAKKKTLIKYEPLGVIYYIIPFNFPFWLSFKGSLGTWSMGNSIIMRPADSCPMVGYLVYDIFSRSGFVQNQYQTVYTTQEQLDRIMANPLVGGVAFTGSSAAGSKIAETAGRHIKKSVMELGGNDPFIVLEDADIEQAAKDAVRGRCANAGQVCFSPKRYVLVGNTYDKFRSNLIEQLKKMVIGDPMDEKTTMGPLAREDLHDNLYKQLARIPSTWKIGWQSNASKPFFPITVIDADYNKPMDEYFFGPVFTLFKAKDYKHAIEIANQGSYGLSASIYTKDRDRGEEILSEVRSGMNFINEVAKSYAVFPTGGVGKSGFGRECGIAGVRYFVNTRVYYVN